MEIKKVRKPNKKYYFWTQFQSSWYSGWEMNHCRPLLELTGIFMELGLLWIPFHPFSPLTSRLTLLNSSFSMMSYISTCLCPVGLEAKYSFNKSNPLSGHVSNIVSHLIIREKRERYKSKENRLEISTLVIYCEGTLHPNICMKIAPFLILKNKFIFSLPSRDNVTKETSFQR